MIDALGRHLPQWVCPPAGGGLSIWARLDGPYSSDLEAAAERHRVRLAAGPRFGVDGTLERFLRLPYALPADQLEEAVIRLAAAYSSLSITRRPLAYAPVCA